MNDKERQTLTIEEAARSLGVGRNAAYDAARRGDLPVIRLGRRLIVPRAALEQLLAAPQRPPTT
jgi:excisionase family DNA binding protein